MGQASFPLVAAPFEGPPKLTLEARSWPKSAKGLEEGGDAEFGDENLEGREPTLLSDGGNGLAARALGSWCVAAEDDEGGARPLPLPKMRPPPSFRPDMLRADNSRDAELATTAQGIDWPVEDS